MDSALGALAVFFIGIVAGFFFPHSEIRFVEQTANIICQDEYDLRDDRLYCLVGDDWIMWKPE